MWLNQIISAMFSDLGLVSVLVWVCQVVIFLSVFNVVITLVFALCESFIFGLHHITHVITDNWQDQTHNTEHSGFIPLHILRVFYSFNQACLKAVVGWGKHFLFS